MTPIRRLQDIQLGNEELLNTYRNYFSNRYIDAAHNLINTNTLRSYVLQAEWMNAVKTKIENIEEPKDAEIDQELANKNTELQYNIDKLYYLQEYTANVQYYKNNFVLYNNKIYFCIQNSLGNLPTNTSYWLDVGLIGKKGQYGLGVTYKGFWDENTSYNKYDLVSYQNNLYIATNNNSGSIPNQYEKYLNDDLYLNNSLHLGYVETNQNWFLLTRVRPQPIYIFPLDYIQLPAHSIFLKEIQTQNLFNWENAYQRGDYCSVENGIFKNIQTDVRTFFASQIQAYHNDEYLSTLASKNISNIGRYSMTINDKIPYGTNRLRFKHNGQQHDIEIFLYYINIVSPFTISFSVDSFDPTRENGLIVFDIQIEKGDTASPYKPFSI